MSKYPYKIIKIKKTPAALLESRQLAQIQG